MATETSNLRSGRLNLRFDEDETEEQNGQRKS